MSQPASPYSDVSSSGSPYFESPSSITTSRPMPPTTASPVGRYHVEEPDELESEAYYTSGSGGETIALVGGNGPTGKHFCRKALEAGYRIRVLSFAASHHTDWQIFQDNHDAFCVVQGNLHNAETLEELLQDAVYVVCLLGDAISKTSYQPNTFSRHVQVIYPLLKESNTQVFLYQATSLSIDTNDKAPIMASLIRQTRKVFKRSETQDDHDRSIRHIGDNTEHWFRYIVVRPGLIRDGTSRKRLAASKSQPGPVPIMSEDLAEFCLNALKNEKLYNTCPYVVGDGF